MAPASPANARELPRFLGHPVEVGERWPEAQAETAYQFANLPNAERSWLTLLRRFLRPWGPRRNVQITAGQLSGITQPTLFIWGRDDPFGSPDAGRAAVELMPHARLEVVGLGHLPWWDEPDSCARLVTEFVRPGKP